MYRWRHMTCSELRILKALSSNFCRSERYVCDSGAWPPFTNTVLRTALSHDALDLPWRQYVVQRDRDEKTIQHAHHSDGKQEKKRVRSKQKEYLALRKSTYGQVGGLLIGMRAGSCSLRVSLDNHIHTQLAWCFLYRCRSNYVTLSCSQYRTAVYRGGDRSRNTRLKPLRDKVCTTMLNLGRSCVCQ